MFNNYLTLFQSKVPPLAFHSMTLCKDTIYIYGGITTNNKINGDLLFLNAFSNKFVNARYEANQYIFPSPRHSHSATYDKTNNKLYIFGGYTNSKVKFTNELWMLEPNEKMSKFVKLQTPEKISPRCQHCSFIYDNKLYIFGGFGINSFNLKQEFLIDLHYIDLKDNLENEVNATEMRTVGEFEMKNSLFKVVSLSHYGTMFRNQFGFFCEDLSYFFILKFIEKNLATFTKIFVKFISPEGREFYSLSTFCNRIIIFGGKEVSSLEEIKESEMKSNDNTKQKDNENKDVETSRKKEEAYIFNEAYSLSAFSYNKEICFKWNSIDYLSQSETKGIFGHSLITLPNEHLFLFGGVSYSFNPYVKSTFDINEDPFSNKTIIINPFETYQWLKPLDDKLSVKLHLPSRISQKMIVMPRDGILSDDFNLFILGGENDGKILCRADIFRFKERDWVPSTQDEFIPQIKNHAMTLIYHPTRIHEVYILISGGIMKEHQGCFAKKNREKERCPCRTEIINTKYYLYKNNAFNEIKIVPKTILNYPLHRIGHNMVTLKRNLISDAEIYLLNGFAQHYGFCFSMIKMTFDIQPKTQEMRLIAEDIVLENSENFGRMNAACEIYKNYIIVFGGIKDEIPLNDILIINIDNKTYEHYENDSNYIFPRFGMSSVISVYQYHEDKNCDNVRMIVYGGSYWSGKNIVYGITNEIIIIKMTYRNNALEYIESIKCDVFGKGSKKVFHSSALYQDDSGEYMISYGGLDNKFSILKLPVIKEKEIETSLCDYIEENPFLNISDLFITEEEKEIELNTKFSFVKEEKDKHFPGFMSKSKEPIEISSTTELDSTKEAFSINDISSKVSLKENKIKKVNKKVFQKKPKTKKNKTKGNSIINNSNITDISDINLLNKSKQE